MVHADVMWLTPVGLVLSTRRACNGCASYVGLGTTP